MEAPFIDRVRFDVLFLRNFAMRRSACPPGFKPADRPSPIRTDPLNGSAARNDPLTNPTHG
ncbi:MAG: hypothetical protein D6788_11005 [Planctomycetota bacterium]|nr:MAG: hypothetical protein D6788_11005 [Planctomycetota bacterium]